VILYILSDATVRGDATVRYGATVRGDATVRYGATVRDDPTVLSVMILYVEWHCY
jgi:hypothetical protein